VTTVVTRINSRRTLRLYHLNRLEFIRMRLRRELLWLGKALIVRMNLCKMGFGEGGQGYCMIIMLLFGCLLFYMGGKYQEV
jgi:hypothetical protein